jgi:hypothetical protein
MLVAEAADCQLDGPLLPLAACRRRQPAAMLQAAAMHAAERGAATHPTRPRHSMHVSRTIMK